MIPLLLLLTAQATGMAAPLPLPDYAHAERVAEAEARAVAFHRRMDADGDGYVTPAEMARYTAGLLKGAAIPGTDATHPLPARSIAYFDAADTDHDGRILLSEAVAAARRDFDRQDRDHDGVVTPAERMAFVTTIVKAGKTPEGVPIASSPASRSADCAATDIVRMTPAETLQLLDDFRAGLSADDRRHLDRALPRDADGGIASCDAREGSRASCEAAAYMPALRSTGLMPRFLATICPRKPDAGDRGDRATPSR